MLLSDEEAEFGSEYDAEDDDARATWCGSHDNSDGRAGRSLGPGRLPKNEMPAVVADLRAGETIGQESLQTFDAEGLLVPLCYEEQEDGSVCHALKVRILRGLLHATPTPKIPADGSARRVRVPLAQLWEHLIVKLPGVRPWQLNADGRLHR